MFTVDLLKGQGVPVKTSPAGIAIVAAGVIIPLIVALILIGIYMNNRVAIPIMEHEMDLCSQKMQMLSDAVKVQQAFEKEKAAINKSAPEAAAAVRKFTVWSPIIRTIAENMPGVMVLNQLDGKQTITKAQESTGQQKGGDAATIKCEVNMGVSGSGQGNWDEEVKGFRSRLLGSSVLKSRIQDIPVSQQPGKEGEKDAVSYEMKMSFRGGM